MQQVVDWRLRWLLSLMLLLTLTSMEELLLMMLLASEMKLLDDEASKARLKRKKYRDTDEKAMVEDA